MFAKQQKASAALMYRRKVAASYGAACPGDSPARSRHPADNMRMNEARHATLGKLGPRRERIPNPGTFWAHRKL
eukprot:scaffold775_cov274-Pinguiococcus_pyrenoidosus.AAC.8